MSRGVGVVGLGLIGGSVARCLHGQGIDVTGYDASAETREAAAEAGLRTVADVAAVCATSPDVLVLAVPLRAMRSVAVDVARHLPGAAATVVADVGSVKGAVRDAMRAAGLADRYVGAHPMAGTERSGFAASDPALLPGARWAVTIDDGTTPDAFLAVLDLVTGPLAGAAYVLTDEAHDEATALVSHVPHVLATELLNLVAAAPVRDVALGLAAGSFRDGTRVGRTDPRRTEAMVVDNAAWVASALRVVVRDLEQLVERLETNASASGFFDRAGAVRDVLDGAASSAPVDGPAAGPVEVALDSAWVRTLTGVGAAGGLVVAVDRERRTVTLAAK